MGQGNAGGCTVRLYVGEGPRGTNGTRSTLHWISVTPSLTHNQVGTLWCWFPSVWACACSRPLWVSPTTSTVRLGVSPAGTPTPTGVFTQRCEALFPLAGALGYRVCFSPRRSSQFIYARMWGRGVLPAALPTLFSATESGPLGLSVCECGAAGSASGQTACPVRPTLHQSQSHHGIASPLHPGCPFPPLLLVWMNVYFLSPWCWTSLPFDFLSVLVVRGGAVCLPMPPSWFSTSIFLIIDFMRAHIHLIYVTD